MFLFAMVIFQCATAANADDTGNAGTKPVLSGPAANWTVSGSAANWTIARNQTAGERKDVGFENKTTNETQAIKWTNKGNDLYEQGDLAGAIAAYDTAIQFNPTDGYIYSNKGVVLNDMGRTSESMACFDKVIELNTTPEVTAYAWNWKGMLIGSQGDQTGAIACYDRSIEIDRDASNATENREKAYAALGQTAPSLPPTTEPVFLTDTPDQPNETVATTARPSGSPIAASLLCALAGGAIVLMAVRGRRRGP